jgi:[ribosomal protein S5]-alanine N-acetyltransferase
MSFRIESIHTERLTLLPFTHAGMLAAIQGRDSLAGALRLTVAADWPNPEIAEAMAFIAADLERTPELERWNRLIVEGGMVIGEIGFKSLPTGGAVEIGYGVCASRRGFGIATEAVLAMVAWAFTDPRVDGVTAECLPSNRASVRVLERSGFAEQGSDAAMRRWLVQRK